MTRKATLTTKMETMKTNETKTATRKGTTKQEVETTREKMNKTLERDEDNEGDGDEV
jgi:hypothetical protein